jgi:hypothetical protein
MLHCTHVGASVAQLQRHAKAPIATAVAERRAVHAMAKNV